MQGLMAMQISEVMQTNVQRRETVGFAAEAAGE
jgi:hypothetical protein